MFSWLCVCVLLAAVCFQPVSLYSYSSPVGKGTGKTFVTEGVGRITAVRVWERNNQYITGIQLKYDYTWTPMIGRRYQNMQPQEMVLFEGEAIVQISGKYHTTNPIRQVYFVTNRGRFLMCGQPYGYSFNHYPTQEGAELLMLSGRFESNGITSIAAHWGAVGSDGNSTSN